jgi:flagellar basal body-associated protein FliL
MKKELPKKNKSIVLRILVLLLVFLMVAGAILMPFFG